MLACAVPMTEDENLARRVRDSFAEQGFTRFFARGSDRPAASAEK